MSLSKGQKSSHLLECLDRAALDPAAWADVCDALADLVDGSGGLLIPYDVEDRGYAMPHSPRLGEVFQQFVETGWHKRDFRAKGFPKAMSTGFVTDQDLITPEEMHRHPYYQEWLSPWGLKWFAGLAFTVRGKVWGAAVHGSPERGPFLSEDITELLRFREHLALAGQRAAALGNQRVEILEKTFSSAARGVVAVNWLGKIIWLNARAEEMLRDAELVREKFLRSADSELDSRLTELVECAVKFRPRRRFLSRPVVAPSRDGKIVSVDALPMPRDFQAMLSGAAALITIHEIGTTNAAAKDTREQFRLTGREAELAAQLASGRGIADAAAALGMSVSTARQHVKSIFAKTGTHRQAELVALLARLPD